ncbi:hypothetical protein [Lactimicrobium massiliense]|uniref:hypothetical protein n=1 Tax=Lactimicrobium massiliense TaxID=2161814 RepID=UPI000D5518B2|nr:hypothetical protein [Lactimicrobium massiliense]
MAKMVGLSRNIKLPWLNKTYELMQQGLVYEDLKNQLNEYLSFEITSPINIRKTREILLHILYYENPTSEKIREDGLELLAKYPEDRTAIYWALMLSVYPVFKDITFIIGKLAEFQDEFTLTQVKQKMYDEWGERSAIFHSTDKIFATMKAMGALKSTKGQYEIIRQDVKQPDISSFMLYTMMSIEESAYRSAEELNNIYSYFPFKYTITREQLLQNENFTLSTFGNEIAVGIK